MVPQQLLLPCLVGLLAALVGLVVAPAQFSRIGTQGRNYHVHGSVAVHDSNQAVGTPVPDSHVQVALYRKIGRGNPVPELYGHFGFYKLGDEVELKPHEANPGPVSYSYNTNMPHAFLRLAIHTEKYLQRKRGNAVFKSHFSTGPIRRSVFGAWTIRRSVILHEVPEDRIPQNMNDPPGNPTGYNINLHQVARTNLPALPNPIVFVR